MVRQEKDGAPAMIKANVVQVLESSDDLIDEEESNVRRGEED